MQTILHRAADRGGADHGWLKTRHSFSFAGWYDPRRMGFGPLRVINDDWIAPHTGFGPHPHKDMEIITIVTKGTLTHEDSMGNVGAVAAGEVQVMSAGTGVVHGERNDGDEPLTLFQIWIEPDTKGIAARYEQAEMHLEKVAHGMKLLVTSQATPGTLSINQDANLYYARTDGAHPLSYASKPGRGTYIFVIDGEAEVAGETLHPRDAIGVTDAKSIDISSAEPAGYLIFDVPLELA